MRQVQPSLSLVDSRQIVPNPRENNALDFLHFRRGRLFLRLSFNSTPLPNRLGFEVDNTTNHALDSAAWFASTAVPRSAHCGQLRRTQMREYFALASKKIYNKITESLREADRRDDYNSGHLTSVGKAVKCGNLEALEQCRDKGSNSGTNRIDPYAPSWVAQESRSEC